MKFRILIDMNLSTEWIDFFLTKNIESIHWSMAGDPKAVDEVILEYARAHKMVVFTHDLDFGSLLALTHATGPSVIQIRSQNVLPENIGEPVVSALVRHEDALLSGSLIVIEERKERVRILPLT